MGVDTVSAAAGDEWRPPSAEPTEEKDVFSCAEALFAELLRVLCADMGGRVMIWPEDMGDELLL